MSTPAAPPRRLLAPAGFSMIELLMAAFILGIGLLGLTALMAANLRMGAGGRQRDTAAYLGNKVLERLAGDGRRSALLRANGQTTFSTAFLVANAVDDVPNTYQVADASGTVQSTFDLDGRPSAASPIFTVTWVRRARGATPVASSGSMPAEVLVNVAWNEGTAGTATVQKWLSFSRVVSY